MSDKFITHTQIAEHLGLNANHVRDKLSKRGDFPPAYRFGGSRRWKESEFLAWVDSKRQRKSGRTRKDHDT